MRPGFILRRLVIEAPFIAFALFLPFIGGGRSVEVIGMSLSVDGLWAAWNILVKATLGLSTTLLLAATTPVADILRGLERLHVPRIICAIAGFMVRYLDVVTGEMRRMRIARESRAYDPRWLWQARAVAHGAGALFIRSFERGERVHLAMVSRGYVGSLPSMTSAAASTKSWWTALALPASASLVAALAWTLA